MLFGKARWGQAGVTLTSLDSSAYAVAVGFEGSVMYAVLLGVLVLRALGYRSEPWWSRWGSAATLAAMAGFDLLGLDALLVASSVLFVISLVAHVIWRLGEHGRSWRITSTPDDH